MNGSDRSGMVDSPGPNGSGDGGQFPSNIRAGKVLPPKSCLGDHKRLLRPWGQRLLTGGSHGFLRSLLSGQHVALGGRWGP